MTRTIYDGYPGLDGPTYPGHSPEEVARYQEMTAGARHRQQSGMSPEGAVQVTAAPEPHRVVDATIAGHLRDKVVRQQRADLARLHKEQERPIAALSGQVSPHLVERRNQLANSIETAEQRINFLLALEGPALTRWAESSGLISWTQGGSPVLR